MSNEIELLIYGASGHAKVVLDAAEKQGIYKILGFLDDDADTQETSFCDYPVLGGFEFLQNKATKDTKIILGIGSNKVRAILHSKLTEAGFEFAIVIHPSAVIGRGVQFGVGTVVMGGVVVNPDSHIGKHVILNTGSTLDHDNVIGDFVHISPGAHLAGSVSVGKSTHLGVGSSVIQGIQIGEESIIGGGAAVVSDLPDRVTAVGVPAKVIKQHES
jgi:acetyltransferase EpsM